jgi:hypothetical protein
VEIALETSRFRGPKTVALGVELEQGKRLSIVFYIMADSQEEP